MPLPPPACATRYSSGSEEALASGGDDVYEGMEAGS